MNNCTFQNSGEKSVFFFIFWNALVCFPFCWISHLSNFLHFEEEKKTVFVFVDCFLFFLYKSIIMFIKKKATIDGLNGKQQLPPIILICKTKLSLCCSQKYNQIKQFILLF